MKPLILASQSEARRDMLKNAGLVFDVIPASLNERDFENKFSDSAPDKLAAALAQEKALFVSAQNPDALVIGADQLLSFEERIFSKADTKEEAQHHLKTLRGKTHTLISAVCVVQNGKALWQYCDSAHLTMHNFGDDFLEHYIEKEEEALTSCVGCYKLEGIGAWLFDNVEGDHFTVRGMPLLPLLSFLREQGCGP